MNIEEAKAKVHGLWGKKLSREDTQAYVGTMSLDGDEAELREYVDKLFQTQPQKNVSYITTDKSGKESLDQERLTLDIMAQTRFAFAKDDDTGYYYSDGRYKENAERYIGAECQRRVGVTTLLSEHKVQEIIGHIRRSNYRDRNEFNCDRNLINTKNGLLNIITRELKPHTPDYLSTVQIPVLYDATADCPNIKKFLADIHNPEDIATMEELFGYLILKDYHIQKAILGVGAGENGKSTEQRLIQAFLGDENCSHVSWQKLEKSQFASSALEGKLVNMFADLPGTGIDTTTTFKMLTGTDPIDAERKFKESYSFLNFAKLWFSTNKPPKVTNEDSYAFWRRWIIIEYPRQFTDADRKTNILETLTTSAELSGLLNYALDGLARLLANGKFSYSRSVEDVTEYYMKASDPVYSFVTACCDLEATAITPKDALYDAFRAYCQENKMPVLKPNAFARSLTNQVSFHIKSTRPIIEKDGKKERIQSWQGIQLQIPPTTVKDVNDVNDFAYTNYAGGRANNDNQIENNPDNPDGKQTTLNEDTDEEPNF